MSDPSGPSQGRVATTHPAKKLGPSGNFCLQESCQRKYRKAGNPSSEVSTVVHGTWPRCDLQCTQISFPLKKTKRERNSEITDEDPRRIPVLVRGEVGTPGVRLRMESPACPYFIHYIFHWPHAFHVQDIVSLHVCPHFSVDAIPEVELDNYTFLIMELSNPKTQAKIIYTQRVARKIPPSFKLYKGSHCPRAGGSSGKWYPSRPPIQ